MTVLSNLRDQLFIMAGVKNSLEAELVPVPNGVAKRGGISHLLFPAEGALTTRLSEIRDLFIQAMDDLQKQILLHFNQKDPAIEEKAQRKILQFCTYLSPFIKQFLKGSDLPYLKFLGEGKDFRYPLWYARLVQKKENLERTIGLAVPFMPLGKLNADYKLNAEDSDRLDEWIKALEDSKTQKVATFRGDKKNPYSRVHSLHRYLSLEKPFRLWDLPKLELELKKRGCTVFDQPDPYWTKVRDNIQPEDSFFVEGKEYKVETRLANGWSIQDQPGLSFIVELNEAYSDLQLKIEKTEHHGIITPLRVAKRCAISIVERLYDPLDTIIWESRDGILSDRDVLQAHPIVGLLAGLCLQPYDLEPLAPKLFAFTLDGEMRALEIMRKKPGPKSFEALEDFTWACSLSQDGSINSAVFTYLMHAGQLVHLPHVKLYQKLMLAALEDKEIKEAVSLDGVLKEQEVLDSRRAFYLSIQRFKKQIKEEILAQYQVLDVKKLHERLVSAFGAVHMRNCPGRLFLPGFSELCKKEVLLDLKPRMNPALLFPKRKELIDRKIRLEEKIFHLYGIYNKIEQEEIYYQVNKCHKFDY